MSNSPTVINFPVQEITASTAPGNLSGSDLVAAKQNLFANLLPLKWRDIGLPYCDFKVVLRQDLAIHKFANLDSADCEPTGRSPLEFSCKIPFLNNISASASEKWTNGILYPVQFDIFWASVMDRTPDYLTHPHFGKIFCVVSHAEVDWKATTRDGVYVEMSWIETIDPTDELFNIASGPGKLAAATQAGVDLNNLVPSVQKILGNVPVYGNSVPNFADFARSLQSVGDQISLLQYQAAGQIDGAINRAQATLNSFSGPTNSPLAAAASVETWQTRDACDRYINSLYLLQSQLLTTGKQVGLYYPAADSSLVLCAQSIPAPVGDLLNLNPALIQEFVVPQGTPVQYYISNS